MTSSSLAGRIPSHGRIVGLSETGCRERLFATEVWVRKQIGSHVVDFVPIPRLGPGDLLPWLLSIEGIVR